MDMQQIYRYSLTGGNISCESSLPTTPLISEWMVGPLNLDSTGSFNSSHSTQFDPETFATLSSSQEHYSSSDNHSVISPSCESSLEFNGSFHQISPSPTHFQDILHLYCGGSSVLQDANCQSMKLALHEIETTLMGDEIEANTMGVAFAGNKRPEASNQSPTALSLETFQQSYTVQTQPSTASKHRKPSSGILVEKRHRQMETSSQKNSDAGVKELLIECAKALSDGRKDDFEKLIQEARGVVSISGEPIQRLGAYLVEGLVARKESSGTNIYRALRCREPASKDLLSYMHILYEICPYLKFGYMAANGAIAEAFRNEDHVHIIDFQIAQGTQWMTLIEALAARPSGPPHMRITGIDDAVSKYARGASLEAVGVRLAAISKKFNIPIEFHAIPFFVPDVTREMLDVRPGEALAVNFPLQLHHTPDESIDVQNPRDGLLRMVKSLSPKVVTLIEQDSNTNTTPFLARFKETLDFYSAMFESIDVTMSRDSKERINTEQHCLARDIVNIIACENEERVERHELLGKWKSRFTMAGFTSFPLSSHVNSVIRDLLGRYSEHYTLVENDGTMLLGWKNRNLISASAWH